MGTRVPKYKVVVDEVSVCVYLVEASNHRQAFMKAQYGQGVCIEREPDGWLEHQCVSVYLADQDNDPGEEFDSDDYFEREIDNG